MPGYNLFNKLLVAGCGFFLCACMGSGGQNLVDPVNEAVFWKMTHDLRSAMQERKIVDNEGAWHSRRISLRNVGLGDGNRAGDLLFRNLSPSFRFPDLPRSQQPVSFQALSTPETRVQVDEYQFAMSLGTDEIHAELVAIVDWTGDGQPDWLVLCIIKSTNAPIRREYYLCLPSGEAGLDKPQILGVRDCLGGTCQFFSKTEESYKFTDYNALDFLPGQEDITAPPNAAYREPDAGPIKTSLPR